MGIGRTFVLLCLLLGLLSGTHAIANPQGAQVVHGQVNFARPDPHTLNITNSQNAIINWQQFSINQNEVTRFIQQSSASAVLNRVVGQDLSGLLGQLLSNGRVFLINPNGIIFGQNAVIDTAGFIASTLNMSNEDFLNGNLNFEGSPESGMIQNKGYIKAGKNGEIYLIAPNIENSGIIETDGGEIILAAGEKLTIASLDHEHIVFDVQAPDNEVVNLGQVLTHGGAARMFAGTIKHSGEINANSIKIDQQGRVQLFAKSNIEITPGSMITANGIKGGTIEIKSETGTTKVSGLVEAKGIISEGGDVKILGERVALINQATVDVSGETGGGEILIGGDYQGNNPEVKNAQQTFVSEDSEIKADAITEGDGGKVIVWADGTTEFHGEISATGGSEFGNGGFAEVSGKAYLLMNGHADLTAANGAFGTLLLDPGSVLIQNGPNTNLGFNTFNDDYIIDQLSSGNLTIDTLNSTTGGNETITVNGNTNITWSQATRLQLDAGRNIVMNIGAVISNTNVSTVFDAIVMNANLGTPVSGTFTGIELNNATLSTVGGGITLTSLGGDASSGNTGLFIRNGTQITTTNGDITLMGSAGDGTFVNRGVLMQDLNTLISSVDGDISITGVGGQGVQALILAFKCLVVPRFRQQAVEILP